MVYDGLVRDVVDGGAGMIVVQTNNATFGFTDESAQQLAMSRLRAVEYGRTVVGGGHQRHLARSWRRTARVVAPLAAVHPRGVRRADIAQRDSTHRGRSGSAPRPEWVLTALGVGALLAVVVPAAVRRRARRRAGR